MANRIDALLSGMGAIMSVANAIAENVNLPPRECDQIRGVGRVLADWIENPQQKQNALALACAVINSTVENRGLVLQVNADCWVDLELYASTQTRKTMAALMFD
jgi:hypothetical protein